MVLMVLAERFAKVSPLSPALALSEAQGGEDGSRGSFCGEAGDLVSFSFLFLDLCFHYL